MKTRARRDIERLVELEQRLNEKLQHAMQNNVCGNLEHGMERHVAQDLRQALLSARTCNSGGTTWRRVEGNSVEWRETFEEEQQ